MPEHRVGVYCDAHVWGPVEVTTFASSTGRYAILVGGVRLFLDLAQLQSFAVQVAAIAQAHAEDAEVAS